MTNSIRDELPEFGHAGWSPGDSSNRVAGIVGHPVYFTVTEPLLRPAPNIAEDFIFRGAELLQWALWEELR